MPPYGDTITLMLIEFSCPVCQTPLAIKKQAVGGQVNCPKCQKLILLPSESPLPRHDPERPPYQNGQTFAVKEVTRAICTSVEPYRRDLETKANLLNDAVEMVKVRNERIKELETLMLNTQGELWALEVEMDGSQQNGKSGDPENSLQKENEQLVEKKEKLKSRLANMIAHSEHLSTSLKAHQEWMHPDGGLYEVLDAVTASVEAGRQSLSDGSAGCEEAVEGIRRLSAELQTLRKQLLEKETARREMEDLVRASSEDMQRALDERNQWRKRATELEAKEKEYSSSLSKLEVRLKEAEDLEKDWTQDRETAKKLRLEMEENLQLLRDRIEQERQTHQQSLQDRENELTTAHEKKTAALNKKLEKLKEDLAASEAKRMDALKAQKVLAEQNMTSEEELGKLKQQLQEMQDTLEELESPNS